MTYSAVLDELEPTWRDDPKDEGAAGAAVAVCVLEDGEWKPAQIPEFDADALATAYQRLTDNGYFQLNDDGRMCLVLDEDTEPGDGMWWVLLMAVAKGYMARR